jgi:23S rRNA pseudouridine1911/1915/1917 synthase
VVLIAGPNDAAARLDQWVHRQLPEYSRSRIQAWIKSGRVLVNGAAARASHVLRDGDRVEVEPAAPPPLHAAPEAIPLTVLYEDADVVAIDKPAGMVVHAGAGIHSGTLVNALVHRFGQLSSVGGAMRPGIVHRLDRFTSGVLLVAKNDAAHQRLAAQFSGRQVEKVYLALVHGRVAKESARIERPIGRDPVRRTRMTARLDRGRAAWSEYRVLRRFAEYTYLEVKIGTGRTHQIRVHFQHIRHPLIGDTVYRRGTRHGMAFPRQALHAAELSLVHPSSGKTMTWSSPLPRDMKRLLDELRAR